MRIALLPGTWSRDDPWWQPGSVWTRALQARGHSVHPAPWSTTLDGILPPHRAWARAADQLRGLLAEAPVDVLLAHSHGGQVATGALAAGATVPLLVTVATPVRRDCGPIYAAARAQLEADGGTWRHLYGGRRDVFGQLGALFDGALSLQRAMAHAHCNVYVPDRGHGAGEWCDPATWDWRWLEPTR